VGAGRTEVIFGEQSGRPFDFAHGKTQCPPIREIRAIRGSDLTLQLFNDLSFLNFPCNPGPNFRLYIREPARNEFLNNEELKKAKTRKGKLNHE
jgi:hypothetical protein